MGGEARQLPLTDEVLSGMTDEQVGLALDVVDDILIREGVFKAAEGINAIQRDLATSFGQKWGSKAKGVIFEAAQALSDAGLGIISQADLDAVLDGIDGKMKGYGFTPAMQSKVRKAAGVAISLAMKGALEESKLDVPSSFALVDKKALNALTKNYTHWVDGYYHSNVREALRVGASEAIVKEGLAGRDAGRRFKEVADHYFKGKAGPAPGLPASLSVPKSYHGTADQYWDGLANHVAYQGNVFGRIDAFKKIGVTKYRIVAVLDRRTSDICRMMHGQVFTIEQAQPNLDAWMSDTPADVKDAAGWQKGPALAKEIGLSGYKPGATTPSMTPAQLNTISSKGLALPPYHFRCRTDVDIEEQVEDLPFIPGEKPPKKPAPAKPKPKEPKKPPAAKPKPKPVPKPPAPKAPTPIPSKPKPGAKKPDIKPAQPTPESRTPKEFPWAEDQLTEVKRGAKGMHEKQFFKDPDGNEWMFKPAPGGKDFRANVESIASEAAKRLGLDSADVFLVKHRGRTGTMHRMFKAVKNDGLERVGIEGLTQQQVEAMQRQHVLDWLIGNNDMHAGNFMVLKDGTLVGIDRGQAFRYFAKDRLATDYNPNAGYGIRVLYNDLFAAAQKGKMPKGLKLVDLDSAPMRRMLEKVASVSDDEWLAMWKPYIDDALKNKSLAFGSRAKFEAELLRRKNSLGKDLDEFYSKIFKRQTREVAEAQAQKGALTKVDAKLARKVGESQNRGATVLVATEKVENGNLLVYRYKDGSTVVEGKVRRSADEVVKRRLVGEDGMRKMAADAADAGGVDPDWTAILNQIKSFNYHLGPGGDGVISKIKQDAFFSKLNALKKKMTDPTATPQNKAKAKYYHDMLSKYGTQKKGIHLGPKTKKMLGVKQEPYTPPKPKETPQRTGGKSRRVKKSNVRKIAEEKRALENGEIVNETGGGLTSAGLRTDELREMIVAELDDGTRIFYTPHDNHHMGQAYSKQGRFRIVVPKGSRPPGAKEIERALDALEDMGVEKKLMTPDDFELLYLRKNAHAMGIADDPVFANISSDLPVKKQVERMLEGFKKKIGKDPRKMAGYNPKPVFYGKEGEGIARFQRFDFSDADIAKRKFTIIHDLYSSSPGDFLLSRIDDGTRCLIATEEKIRRGIPLAGMSPGADQNTGGAQFVFLRIRKGAAKGRRRIHLKKALLRDTNAVSYNGDYFGNMEPSFKEARRAKTVPEALKMTSSSNETLIKNEVPLEMWDHIDVGSAAERTRVLGELRKRGIKEIGGTPIEDFVR